MYFSAVRLYLAIRMSIAVGCIAIDLDERLIGVFHLQPAEDREDAILHMEIIVNCSSILSK